MPDRDDAIDGGDLPLEIEQCPLCEESINPTLVDQILRASQTAGPTFTAEEFFQWLQSELPATGD